MRAVPGKILVTAFLLGVTSTSYAQDVKGTSSVNVYSNVNSVSFHEPGNVYSQRAVEDTAYFEADADMRAMQVPDDSNAQTGNNTLSVKVPASHNSSISVWPNPMEDMLNISFQSQTGRSDLTIINAGGQVVHKQILDKTSTTIFFDPPKGVYLLTITDGDNFYSRKVVRK